MKILLTGCAGFIGFHVAKALLERGNEVIGVDNLNSYYSVHLKHLRLNNLNNHDNFKFIETDITSESLYENLGVDNLGAVVHLAAQAGVRYSLQNPYTYVDSNIKGQIAILELCRKAAVKHLVYASSSSVYGNSKQTPFKETDAAIKPVSVYAASKRAAELMAETYAALYGLTSTGLRFFTVYGPYGRPDMSPWLFTDAILKGEPINLFAGGILRRDFTYIDDIVAGVVASIEVIPEGNHPHRVVNLGNNKPVVVKDFVKIIENITGKTARIIEKPMQQGDVEETCADITLANSLYNFTPKTDITTGMQRFIEWYERYSR